MKENIAAYYQLTKPGIVRGNAVHVFAGALLASVLPITWGPLLGVLIGTSLVIASACIANNYMDRNIDAKMKRTSKRPSVTGKVAFSRAMVFAVLLLIIGFFVLVTTTNQIVVAIGAVAYLSYVFAYGWAKRRTVHSTLIGAVPGALPAMAGYVAITGQLTIGAWLIFLLIVTWQMPHFYAISLFRKHEYKSAGLPVLGAKRPFVVVRRHMLAYMLAYVCVIALMIATWTVQPAVGMLLVAGSAYWLYTFFRQPVDETKWAQSVFGISLVLTIILLIASLLNVFITPAP